MNNNAFNMIPSPGPLSNRSNYSQRFFTSEIQNKTNQVNDPNSKQKLDTEEDNFNILKPFTDFERYQIPPNWELARLHSKSRKVSKERDEQYKKVCPCCGYEIFRQDLNLCDSVYDFKILGNGVFFLFILTKYAIIFLISMLIIIGLPFMYMNSNGDFCWRNQKTAKQDGLSKSLMKQSCFKNSVSTLSLINIIDDDQSNKNQDFLIIIMVSFTMIFLIFVRKQLIIFEEEEQLTSYEAHDFTLELRDLNIDYSVDTLSVLDKELQQFFGSIEAKVHNIIPTFDLHKLKKTRKMLKAKVKELQHKLKERGFKEYYSEEEIKTCQTLSEEVLLLIKQLQQSRDHTKSDIKCLLNKVFVQFQTIKDRDKVEQFSYDQVDSSIAYYLTKKNLEHSKRSGALLFKGSSIKIKSPTEPNDIIWKNLAIPKTEKSKRRIKTFFQYLLILIIVFIFLSALKSGQMVVQKYFKKLKKGQSFNTMENLGVSLLEFVIPLTILLMNKVYTPYIKKMIKYESWNSNTKKDISYAIKYVFGGIILQLIVILVILGYIFKIWYGKDGYIYIIEKMFLMKPLVKSIMKLIDNMHLKKMFKIEEELQQNASILTQQEANELMELPNYNVAKPYSELVQSVLMVSLISPLLPVTIFYCIIGLILFYWTEKKVLIKQRSNNQNITSKMTIQMIDMLDVALIFFPLGNIFFRYVFTGKIYFYSLLSLGLGCIYCMLPLEYLTKTYFFKPSNKSKHHQYTDLMENFDTSYELTNPILNGEALVSFVQLRRTSVIQGLSKDHLKQFKILK